MRAISGTHAAIFPSLLPPAVMPTHHIYVLRFESRLQVLFYPISLSFIDFAVSRSALQCSSSRFVIFL
jgi:hypothetical protein